MSLCSIPQDFRLPDLGLRFDIDKAKQLCGAPFADPDAQIPAEAIRWALRTVDIHAFHVCSDVDLSKPLMIGYLGPEWPFLMDGNHRATNGLIKGRTEFAAYVLSTEETRFVCNDSKKFDRIVKQAAGFPHPIHHMLLFDGRLANTHKGTR